MDLNIDATELRLGLPGTDENKKSSSPSLHTKRSSAEIDKISGGDPLQKQQIVGWPPVRSSYRKNILHHQSRKTREPDSSRSGSMFVKVSMDGVPYLRKIDLKLYTNYADLLEALESMYKCNLEREGCNSASSYAPTYQDKDGDWMLVGDVPWEMFLTSCKRMRIMKGSEAKGLQNQVQQLFAK